MTDQTGLLLRKALVSDLEAIHQLAVESGIGITTLPKNIDILEQRLTLSTNSFDKVIQRPGSEYYLFVVEDSNTHQIVGTSAIKASIGHTTPSYTYNVIHRTRMCHALNIRQEQSWLILSNNLKDKSEVCTLYLKPNYRHSHHGVFISRARFLFMAQHPSRFETSVIAEMRGVSDEKGESPFWDGLGQHFFNMPFQQADELTLATNKQFIMDLIPEHPILVQLLSENAQKVIGKPHRATVPAMHILLKEGFHLTNMVDIFDAGPIIEAHCADIKTIQASQCVTVTDIVDELSAPASIIANTLLSFRATIGPVIVNQAGAVINKMTADRLQIKQGDTIRFIAI